jgi:hypothetical protein
VVRNVTTGMMMGKLIHPEPGGTMCRCGVKEIRRTPWAQMPNGKNGEAAFSGERG